LLLSWYIRGITVLYILVFVLISYIYILSYLLGHLPSKASLLALLFLSLGVLLLYFLPLLSVTDLEILVVLVTRLLRRDLDRLVNGMEPVEPWDEG
jgi:hypothetical protein